MTDQKVEELLSKHYEGLALRPQVAAKTFAGGLVVGVLVMALAVSLVGMLPAKPMPVTIGRDTQMAGNVAVIYGQAQGLVSK